jgi:acyl dehydratase
MNLPSAGNEIDLGTRSLSRQEITDFARAYDPLDFHLDEAVAKQHLFKDLVASGAHLFHLFYKEGWIPRYGSSVLCGLAVDNWKFLRPVYPDQPIRCRLLVSEVIRHPEKGSVSVRWNFNFEDPDRRLVQHLEMLVLHRES